MRIVVKIGGAQLESQQARADLCAAIARARSQGHQLIVVHGGGNQIRELSRKLGLAERYHEGLRITDAAMADVVLMVLGGMVNRELVAALERAGVRAAGLTGADGSTFSARKLVLEEVDLGFVGAVDSVDSRLVETLLDAGVMPVIATAAPIARGSRESCEHFYNINADHAAGPLARELCAEALLFLTDVPGVLDGERARIGRLTPQRCRMLIDQGVIAGGMLPKVAAALRALEEHPGALIKIAPAQGMSSVTNALEADTGTRFVAVAVDPATDSTLALPKEQR